MVSKIRRRHLVPYPVTCWIIIPGRRRGWIWIDPKGTYAAREAKAKREHEKWEKQIDERFENIENRLSGLEEYLTQD